MIIDAQWLYFTGQLCNNFGINLSWDFITTLHLQIGQGNGLIPKTTFTTVAKFITGTASPALSQGFPGNQFGGTQGSLWGYFKVIS